MLVVVVGKSSSREWGEIAPSHAVSTGAAELKGQMSSVVFRSNLGGGFLEGRITSHGSLNSPMDKV